MERTVTERTTLLTLLRRGDSVQHGRALARHHAKLHRGAAWSAGRLLLLLLRWLLRPTLSATACNSVDMRWAMGTTHATEAHRRPWLHRLPWWRLSTHRSTVRHGGTRREAHGLTTRDPIREAVCWHSVRHSMSWTSTRPRRMYSTSGCASLILLMLQDRRGPPLRYRREEVTR